MKSDARISLRGFAGKDAVFLKSKKGKEMAGFSLGVPNFHKDRESGKFVSDHSSWYNVLDFNDLN